MNLATLIQSLPIRLQRGSAQTCISTIVDDSRRVVPGSLFIARPGCSTDGRRFIQDAIDRGAAAVLGSESVDDVPPGPAVLATDDLKPVIPALLGRFHDHPADQLSLVGVTGTNGKTTTAYILRHLLRAAGRKPGLIGTVEIDDGHTTRPSELTTPGLVEMAALLAAMADASCDSCVMEVSSHALDQGRADGLSFAAGVFTNLTGDHLDYHKTMEAYAAAKARLFESLSETAVAVVNADDPAHKRMIQNCRARVIRFGIDRQDVEIAAEVRTATARGTECVLKGLWGELNVHLPLIGRHNLANVLGAVGAANGLGVDVQQLADALADCPQPPGRLERVLAEEADLPFEVLVDYAHTDDALANVLRALAPVTTGRLCVLFGCGGDRDRTKRPRMAKTACEMADRVMVTSDNPRTENPQRIVDDILAGVGQAVRSKVEVEIDRKQAIDRIVGEAEPGDVVLLAGKGHEDYQIIGTQKRAFDDRKVARAALQRLAGAAGTRSEA